MDAHTVVAPHSRRHFYDACEAPLCSGFVCFIPLFDRLATYSPAARLT
jgi:hypothetical protein